MSPTLVTVRDPLALKQALVDRGLSQHELARQTNVSVSFINSLCLGTRQRTNSSLAALIEDLVHAKRGTLFSLQQKQIEELQPYLRAEATHVR